MYNFYAWFDFVKTSNKCSYKGKEVTCVRTCPISYTHIKYPVLGILHKCIALRVLIHIFYMYYPVFWYMYRAFFIIYNSTNESIFTINLIYKVLGSYMFRHQICHLQGARSVTLLNYIYTITVFIKINKVFKIFKLKFRMTYLISKYVGA